MDISKLCRSCMKEVASWERDSFDNRTVKMFCFCTNIQITANERLPKQFCYDCIIKIEAAFIFITEAQKVDARLKNIISRTSSSVIVKSDRHKTIDLESTDYELSFKDYKESMLYNTNIDEDIVQKKLEIKEITIKKENKVKNNNNQKMLPCIMNINVQHNTEDTKKNMKEMLITVETQKECFTEDKEQHHDNEVDKINVEEIKKFTCPICRKQFSSKCWFNKHLRNEHNGQNFICDHCQKTFSKKWELTKHLLCHSEERKYPCPDCGKCFKWRNQLRSHSFAHSECRPFECDLCSMKFKFKSVLKSHIETIHSGEKQYLCCFCGRSFAQAGNLQVHMRKHTGDKPYSCNECSFRSTVGSSLKRHQRRHRRLKTYVCKQCSKGFYDQSSLERHIRIHTGELPFKCPCCARAFVDSWKRKTHLMRAHRLQLNDIPPMRRDGTAIQ